MIQNNINMIIKHIIVNMYSTFLFLYIVDYRKTIFVQKVLLIISTLVISTLNLLLYNIFSTVISMVTSCILHAIILKQIICSKVSNVLIASIIAHSITYIFLIISATLEFMIQHSLNISNISLNIAITYFIEGFLLYSISKSKRFKRSFTFINRQNEYMEFTIINIAIILVLVQGLMSNRNEWIYYHLHFYYIILGVFFVFSIQKTITLLYKQKLVEDTINQYKQELQEKEIEIKRLTDEAFKISKINHEFYNRQKSLELMVENALKNTNMEAGEELDLMDRIKEITQEHSNKMKSIKSLPSLPVTELCELDDMFKYMQTECSKSNIQFKLNINGNIYPLVNNIITENKLVTLIGDHIRDAIIAVNASDKSNKEIFVVLGLKDDCYELCILDTGIEFEIDTLLKLGLMPVTTHKDSGGSGIGFITTFETLKECKGSLIIEEKHKQNETDYTKAVKIRFDGKNEYRICSYRLDEILKDKNKYQFSDKELVYRKINK